MHTSPLKFFLVFSQAVGGKEPREKRVGRSPSSLSRPLSLKQQALWSKGIKAMKELNIKNLPLMELDGPNGVDAETCVEQFLGTLPTAHEDMPDEADVDATAFIKLK